ncbi:MAG: hypothetical protein M3R38_21475 [Actinomycetota bacterium]|nr:hypothetical protein [Actinomycetota bacterium]
MTPRPMRTLTDKLVAEHRHEGEMNEREAFRRQGQLIAQAWAEMGRQIAGAMSEIARKMRPVLVDAEVVSGTFPERYAEALGEDEDEVFI